EKDGFTVTEKGESFFTNFQIDLERVKKKRRSFTHKCLDWSERRHHLAGALGNALLERLLELNWVQRLPKTRAIKITSDGKKGLKETFSFDITNN
ncbi:transcriptional regulator, partial [Bacillus toyonensis]